MELRCHFGGSSVISFTDLLPPPLQTHSWYNSDICIKQSPLSSEKFEAILKLLCSYMLLSSDQLCAPAHVTQLSHYHSTIDLKHL